MNLINSKDVTGFDCSHALRLSGVDWLIVAAALLVLLAFGPTAWERFEKLDPGADYRMPYALGSDYWLYSSHCRDACAQSKTLVIGDSVVW